MDEERERKNERCSMSLLGHGGLVNFVWGRKGAKFKVQNNVLSMKK